MECEDCSSILQELGLQEVYDTYWKDKKIPIIGTLEITYGCNFRCVHCYADNKHSDECLSYDEIVDLVDQMTEAGTFFLTLSGGDPLVHPRFIDIYRYIKNKGMFVEVFTNAAAINKDIIQLFQEYPPVNVDITIYGASEMTYEKVTHTKGNFSRVHKAIDMLESAGIHYTLKTSRLQNK